MPKNKNKNKNKNNKNSTQQNYNKQHREKLKKKNEYRTEETVINNLANVEREIKKAPQISDFSNIKKILYRAKMKLKTALHIGCAQSSPVGAFEIMKNGAGEYIIPGTSIAGVFWESLRILLELDNKNDENSFLFSRCNLDNNAIYLVPEGKEKFVKKLSPYPIIEKLKIYREEENFFVIVENNYHNSEGKIKKEFIETFKNSEIKKYRKSFGSPLVFRTVNLGKTQPKQIRNRTKIDRETKTADDGALFSYWEIEPENVSFEVKVEIDNISINNSNEDIETLHNWVELVFSSWKSEGVFFGGHNTSGNGYCLLEKLERLSVDSGNFENYIKDIDNYLPVPNFPVEVNKRFKTWKIIVDINDDNYGTNALLIKGGISHSSLVKNPSDAVFINTGERLFIPGSSLKGTFSMFLEKYGHKDWLKDFLGQEDSKNQGYIYFPDLIFSNIVKDEKKHLVNIERHAEDEFTRAVLGSSKFNEERLFYAKVEGEIRVPLSFYNGIDSIDKKPMKEKIINMMNFLKQGCDKRLISLGANGCYPKITIEEE